MIPPDSDSANSGGQQAADQGNGDNSNRRNRNRNRSRNRSRSGNGGNGGNGGGNNSSGGSGHSGGRRQGRVRGYGPRDDQGDQRDQRDQRDRRPFEFTGDPVAVDGLFEIAPKGFGFLRKPDQNFEQRKEDVFVPPDLTRKHGLRPGVWLKGVARDSSRGPQMIEVTSVNGEKPEDSRKLPAFEELKAVNPNKQIGFETTPDRFTTRLVDLIAPVGRGQRGLIVSPPRSGKTTLLLHMAQAVQERHEEHIHLMILLVDERPEEVTEFRRQLPDAEIYASSNDESPHNHCRLAELCVERAKRLVEAGKHVFILMDSITRLARAYNNNLSGAKQSRGRGYQSGGIVAGALEMPRRLFAAARNTREAGSLTIIATALIQTNSKADEAIFQEFKGTGNMELVLDRRIAEHYVYPAADIFKSGTRREELILPEMSLNKICMVRRGLAGHKPVEAMERLLFFMKKFPGNAQMLMEIKG
ncbi:MAG: transcription termination factor Rho [Akkermansiaceae bacterium]|jgi:transcription termination factor Rho